MALVAKKYSQLKENEKILSWPEKRCESGWSSAVKKKVESRVCTTYRISPSKFKRNVGNPSLLPAKLSPEDPNKYI